MGGMSIDALRPRDFDYQDRTIQFPTRAGVSRDVAELRASLDAVKHDLEAPAIVKYVTSASSLYYAYVKVNVTIGQLASAAYSLSQGDGKEALRALTNALDLPAKLKALVDAHHEFAKSNGPATNRAFAQVLHDIAHVYASALRVAADLGGV